MVGVYKTKPLTQLIYLQWVEAEKQQTLIVLKKAELMKQKDDKVDRFVDSGRG